MSFLHLISGTFREVDPDGRPYEHDVDEIDSFADFDKPDGNAESRHDTGSTNNVERQNQGRSIAWERVAARRQRWEQHQARRKQQRSNKNVGAQPRSSTKPPTGSAPTYEETSFLVKIVGMYRILYNDGVRETTFRIIAMENLAYGKGKLSSNKHVQVRWASVLCMFAWTCIV